MSEPTEDQIAAAALLDKAGGGVNRARALWVRTMDLLDEAIQAAIAAGIPEADAIPLLSSGDRKFDRETLLLFRSRVGNAYAQDWAWKK